MNDIQQATLATLQGKWLRNDNSIIEISGETIKLPDEDITAITWRSDEKWVAPGGLTVWQLSVNEKDEMVMYVPSNGPFSSLSLTHSRIK